MIIFTVPVINLPGKVGSTNSEMAKAYELNASTPKYGGTLRTVGNAARRFNPLTNQYLSWDTHGIFDTLITYDENCSLIPDLAEDYEASEDGLSLTFHLYENVTWHDGIEFNASDVKFTFDSILYDPNVDQLWTAYVFDINSIEVINASTIVFHLDEPLGCLPQYLSFVPIIPRHIYEDTNLKTNYADPIGTGPFKFESRTTNINLTVTANEQYFRGRPYLDKIVFETANSLPDITAAFENNALDQVSSGYLDPSRMQYLESTPGTSVTTNEAAEYWCIYLNMSKSILQSRSVREAIAHAVNKTKITTEAFYGYASPAKGPLPSCLKEWYNPNVIDYELNKTLAEELLDQEYPRGEDGWRFNLAIGTVIYSDTPWRVNAANMIIDDLKSVGINATIQFDMGVGGYWNFDDAFLGGFRLDTFGPDDLYVTFHSNELGNFGKYSNATVDALLEEGRSSFNETLRKIDFDRAQEIIVEDVAAAFLYSPDVAMAYNNDFHGRIFTAPVSLLFTPYYLQGIWYDPTLSGEGNCPYRVCFTDSEGRRTGYHDGIAYGDIPDSTYSGMDSDPQLVKVREADGIYTVELFGTENASYKFEFANMALNYKNVRIPEGFIHENETITYIVKVFQDGSMKVYDYDKYSEHDLGILSMATPKTLLVHESGVALLNVSVFNWGNFTESFNVTVYANTAIIETREVALTKGDSLSLTFSWNLSGIDYGKYTISSYSWPVSGEIDTSDNNFTLGVLKVTIWGDINGDFTVDIYDAIILANAYNSKPDSPNWNPNADLKPDGIIDIYDAIILANHYNQHYP